MILVRNAETYTGCTSFVPLAECTVKNPVCRKLRQGECVIDIDGTYDAVGGLVKDIIEPLENSNIIFWLWASSSHRYAHWHLCFFCQHVSVERKLAICDYVVHSLCKGIYEWDNLPIKRGEIGYEGRKTLLYTNYVTGHFFNIFDDVAVPTGGEKLLQINNATMTLSMRTIMDATGLTDIRARCIFCIVSYFVANGKSESETVKFVREWCRRNNNYGMPTWKLQSIYNSSNGTVGEKYRKELLKKWK